MNQITTISYIIVDFSDNTIKEIPQDEYLMQDGNVYYIARIWRDESGVIVEVDDYQ